MGGIGDGIGGGVMGGGMVGIIVGSDCAPAGDGPPARPPPPPERSAPANRVKAMNDRMYLCTIGLLRADLVGVSPSAYPPNALAKSRPNQPAANLTPG